MFWSKERSQGSIGRVMNMEVSIITVREQWRAPPTDSHCRSRQQREGMMQCFTVVLGSPCSNSVAVDQELLIENPEFSVFPCSRR